MELSVIIPSRDAAGTLGAQLGALAGERPPFSWEVVVVDNGSSDHTADVATSFVDRLPSLVLVDEPRQGRHHACNRGALVARGHLLAFVDADDVVVPGYLVAMHRALGTADVVAGRLDHRGKGDEPLTEFGSVQTGGLMPGHGFRPYAAGGNLGIRAEALRAVEGFHDDTPYTEDVDLSWRLLEAGYAIEFAADAAVIVNQRTSLSAMFRQHRRYGRGLAFLYRKYAPKGMPRRGRAEVVGDWAKTIKAVPRLTTPATRARFVRRLARNLGRVEGSILARVMYL